MAGKRHGYGWRRREDEFQPHHIDQLWIDHPGTDRAQRTAMLRDGLERGDTVVVLARGDLGAGGEIPLLHAELTTNGVALNVIKPPKKPGNRGRRAVFAPSPEQDEEIKALWHDARFAQAYVLRRASEIMGFEVKRYHLTHRYKARQGDR